MVSLCTTAANVRWTRRTALLLGTSLAPAVLALGLPRAHANPTGGSVIAGQATIGSAGRTLTVTQTSNRAIVNWQNFSIGARENVSINQPNAASALLNRVTGANQSALLGSLSANGQVYLINPNGVVVGPGAHIDAGAFFASTAQIGNSAFMGGDALTFSNGTDASIVNLGVIKATSGDAVLVGHRVDNQGKIDAPNGTAALIAATEFTYTPASNTPVTVAAGRSTDTGGVGVNNAGRIKAANAQLVAADGNLYALAVNQSGVVKATGVKVTDGRILLTADGGTVSDSGTLSAHKADGGGGSVIVGGTPQGADRTVPNATTSVVTSKAVINVAAKTKKASGGNVAIWSTQQTNFAGTVAGRGGAQGGNGGIVEVSSARTLNYTGLTDLRAPRGTTGTLLLDPDEAIISSATDDQANGVFNASVLATALATANVTVETSTGYGDGNTKFGDIVVNAAVTWTSGNTLTLNSADNINVNANLTGGTASGIVFGLGVAGDGGVTILTTGDLNVASNATVHAGTVTITENNAAASIGSGNLPPAAFRSIGSVAFDGILQANTLDLQLNDAGAKTNVTLANAANTIGTLASSVGTGNVGGTLNIVNGSGDLAVTGAFANVGGQVDIQSAGNLTLASGSAVSTNNAGGADIHLIAGGSFINNAGGSAVAIDGTGRYLIYSNAPATTTLGGLAVTPVYNKTFASNAPASITQTGNRVLYSLAPTLTLTADDQSSTYGSAIPSLTYTVSGLVGSDTAAQAFGGTPNLSTSGTASSNAGKYTISAAAGSVLASDYDYAIQFATGALTINPAPLTIRANNLSVTQNLPIPALTTTFSGLVNGDTAGSFTGLSVSTTAVNGSTAGAYPITVSGAVNNNYNISFQPGTMTVNAAPTLTITADDFAKLYGAALPTFTSTISGFNPGDTASLVTGLTLTTKATASSPVGGFAIVPSGASAPGYVVTFVNGLLTINPAPLLQTISNANRQYGQANPSFGATYSGLVNGDTSAVVTGATFGTTATQSSDVGTYSITGSGATASNYTITTAPGTLTVNTAPLTITATSTSKPYGDLNPTLAATQSGLQLGQSLAQLGTLSLNTTAVQLSNVGDYPITTALNGRTSLASDYAISLVPGTLSVTARPVTVTPTSTSRSYGDVNPSFVVTYGGTAPPGNSIAGLIDATGLTVGTTANAASNVGTYPVTASGIVDPNFAVTYVPGVLTVNKAPLTVGLTSTSRFYGDPNPTPSLTATGLLNGDTISVITASIQSTAGPSSVPASYTNSFGSASAANYNLTLGTSTLTVQPRPLTITANDATRLYLDLNPTFTATYSGLASFDTPSVISGLSLTTAATANTPVQQVGISATGAVNPNYAITMVPGTLTIAPRPVTVTANDAARTYGSNNPAFTTSIGGIDPPGGTLASLFNPASFTVATAATAASSAGVYSLTPSSGANANFAFTFVPGSLTVNKAPLTVTANDASRLYGDGNPAFSSSVSGLQLTDTVGSVLGTLNYATGTTATTGIGTYSITPSATALASNYNVTFQQGALTIQPRPLTITPDPANRIYGDSNPAFTASYNGLASFDTSSVVSGLTLTTSATQATPAGPATITAANATSPNYAISFQPGTLTITPAPLTFTPGAQSVVYGQAYPSAGSFAVSGLKLSQNASVLGATLTGVAAQADVGTYDFGVAVSNPNYTVASGAGKLQITPAPVTVTIGGVSRFYGDADLPLTQVPLTVTGLAYGQQNSAAVTLNYAVNDAAANAGNYAIQGSAPANSNYTITSVTPGTLTVLPRPIVLKPANVVRYYGDDNPAYQILVAGNGLAPFDSIGAVASTTQFSLDGTTVSTLPGTASGIGQHSLGAILTNNANYAVINVPGVFAVLPRPITLTVADQTFTADVTPPANSATASNLAPGQTLASAFPALTFATAQPGDATVLANPYTPATYPMPTGYLSDAAFGLAYLVKASAQGTTPIFNQGPALPPALASATLPTAASTTSFFTGVGSLSASADPTTPTITFVTATNFATNTNYAVTAITPGKITINPSAATVAAAQQAAAAAQVQANKDAFYQVTSGNSTGAFGLPVAALPSLVTAIKSAIANELAISGTVSHLSQAIELALGHAADTKMTDADLYAYLADLSSNPAKQAVIGPVLSNYINQLSTLPAASYSVSDKALAALVDARMAEAKPKLAATALEIENQASSFKDKSADAMMGGVTPYATYLTLAEIKVASDMAQPGVAGSKPVTSGNAETVASVSAGLAAGVAGGGAAVAGVTTESVVEGILPFSEEFASGFAAGPIGIAVVAAAVIVQGTIQIIQNADQQQVFNRLTDPSAPAPTLAGFSLANTTGPVPKVNAAANDALLSMAISEILLSN